MLRLVQTFKIKCKQFQGTAQIYTIVLLLGVQRGCWQICTPTLSRHRHGTHLAESTQSYCRHPATPKDPAIAHEQDWSRTKLLPKHWWWILYLYMHTSRDRTSRPTRFATSHTLSTPYPSCEPSFKSSGQTCSRTTRPHGPKPSEKEAGATQRVKYQGGWGQSCVDCVCMVFDPFCQYLSIRISEVLGDVHLLQCLH